MRYTPSRTLLASAIASIILTGCGGGSGGGTKSPSSSSSGNSSTAVNVAPKFTSSTSVSRDEGASKLTGYTAVAMDSNNDSLTFSLSAGADKALFAIDATSGLLSFVTAPDFEKPADANLDNVYEVEVTVVDGKGGKSSQLVMVAVKNVTTKLTALSKSIDTELIPGNTVTAQSSCDSCDTSLTKYEWYVEGSATPVSTTNSYQIKSEDRFKKITLKATPYTTSGEAGNTETVVMLRNQVKDFIFQHGGFVVVRTDGSLLAKKWDKIVTNSDLNVSNVKSVHIDGSGFSVLDDKDTLVAWIESGSGEKNKRVEIKNAATIYDGAALSKDHKLYAWHHGIGTDESSPPLENIVEVTLSRWGSTWPLAAVKADGTVVRVASTGCGSDNTSPGFTNIVKVSISGCVFAGLTENGVVKVTEAYRPSEAALVPTGLDLTNVVDVVSNGRAFAALKSDGSVVTWGDPDSVGDIEGKDLTNVARIVPSEYAFAAIKTDGTVVSWGDEQYGGNTAGKDLTNVVDIIPSLCGFAAVKADKSVTTWGTACRTSFDQGADHVAQLLSNGLVFVALKDDGTVINLPNSPAFFYWEYSSGADFKDVVKIFGNSGIYAALKNNGEVFSWGDFIYGGSVDGVDLAPFDDVVSSTLESNP